MVRVKPENIMPHWHKEKRSNLHRRTIFRFLKYAGVPKDQATRMRDWSMNHIILYLDCNIKGKSPKQKTMAPQMTEGQVKESDIL